MQGVRVNGGGQKFPDCTKRKKKEFRSTTYGVRLVSVGAGEVDG